MFIIPFPLQNTIIRGLQPMSGQKNRKSKAIHVYETYTHVNKDNLTGKIESICSHFIS